MRRIDAFIIGSQTEIPAEDNQFNPPCTENLTPEEEMESRGVLRPARIGLGLDAVGT
jgi:hypothetical protein